MSSIFRITLLATLHWYQSLDRYKIHADATLGVVVHLSHSAIMSTRSGDASEFLSCL